MRLADPLTETTALITAGTAFVTALVSGAVTVAHLLRQRKINDAVTSDLATVATATPGVDPANLETVDAEANKPEAPPVSST